MISIIIPVYNENTGIIAFLSTLQKRISTTATITEIILVDGWSVDWTVQTLEHYLKTYSGSFIIKLHHTKKSRAIQQNLWAYHAQWSVLFFLFADTLPSVWFDTAIIKQINQGYEWWICKFRLSPWTRYTRLLEKVYNQPWMYWWKFGDSGIIVTKKLHKHLWGFDETKQIEEWHEYIMKLYKHWNTTLFPIDIEVSDRVYKQHWYLQVLFLYLCIHFFYLLWLWEQPLLLLLKRYRWVKK